MIPRIPPRRVLTISSTTKAPGARALARFAGFRIARQHLARTRELLAAGELTEAGWWEQFDAVVGALDAADIMGTEDRLRVLVPLFELGYCVGVTSE